MSITCASMFALIPLCQSQIKHVSPDPHYVNLFLQVLFLLIDEIENGADPTEASDECEVLLVLTLVMLQYLFSKVDHPFIVRG